MDVDEAMDSHPSPTLRQCDKLPETACVDCPNAIWHLTAGSRANLRVFCLLMHALIDEPLRACDGTIIVPRP